MYYRSEGRSVCADVIPYYEDGKFYLFYLKDFRDVENHGEGCPWCLLTSEDLATYEEHGEVLVRGTEEEQDLYVFTGSCSKFNGEYYIFYTGHNPKKRAAGLPEQKILLAKSSDLYHWEKVRDFVFAAPDWLEMHDFRDPFVYYDEESGRYHMLLAGRVKNDNPTETKGVTLLAVSDDLIHWEVSRQPFYAPDSYFTHECPDLFKMGDWWYLVFSEFTDKVVTTYRMAKSPNGPWIMPKVNTFDGHAFYAAKTASDGKRRFLFGWNCIKDQEKDDAPWQWGGTIIPHEVVQAEDGTLYVKCPEEIRAAYSVPVPLEDGYEVGPVCTISEPKAACPTSTISESKAACPTSALPESSPSPGTADFRIGSNSGRALKLLGRMPENCRLEADFTVSDDIGDFGILLRTDERVEQYYAVKFEPKFNRLAFDKVPRRENTVHTQVDVERYCPIRPGEKNHLLLIAEGSVLEVYVNDRVAMSARMFDRPEGQIGLYAQYTTVEFKDVSLRIADGGSQKKQKNE